MLNKHHIRIIQSVLIVLGILLAEKTLADDTIFVAKHHFESPVNNVFMAKGEVYVKAGPHIYKRSGQKWEKIRGAYRKYFVFFNQDFFEHDQIPREYVFPNIVSMKHLIPQQTLVNPTLVQTDNSIFLAVGGSLFEYAVNNSYVHRMPDYSFRHIYQDRGLAVLSTYNGIFIKEKGKDSAFRKVRGLNFSNGNFFRSRFGDLIASDILYKFYPPDSFAAMPIPIPSQYGKVLKGMVFGDSLALQLSNSICLYHESTGLRPVTVGYAFTDVEVSADSLIFCTNQGKVFSSKGAKVTQLGDLKQKIRDIFPLGKEFYLATETGVFLYTSADGKFEMVAEVPRCAGIVIDIEQNLWVSTDDGLYIIPKGENTAIPFIRNVEFNKGALTYHADLVFAGSIQGMYVVDNFIVTKNFIPAAVSRVKLDNNKRWAWWIAIASIIIFAGWVLRQLIVRRRRISLPVEDKPSRILTLQQIEEDITTSNIQTVDQLAEHLQTNPVQLNRIFKGFQTTPGKFLKEVKIRMAKKLLKEGTPIREVSERTGYSVQLLKSELKKQGDI